MDELVSLGAHVEPVVVPLLEEAGTIVQAIMLPEATQAHLGWLRTRLPDYGPDVRARLLAGLLLPSTAYVTGLRARRWYLNELRPVFERFDLLVQPAMPVIPPRIGEETVSLHGEEIPYRLALIPFNSPWSLAGAPVASVPCGFVEDMPAGLALVGRPSGEATVLRAAATFQHVTDWHRRVRRQPSGRSRGSGVRAGSDLRCRTRKSYTKHTFLDERLRLMSVLIKGGRIVTAADDYVGDIFIDNGTVSLIGESLDVAADKVIDAAGKYVIPGAIDPHTHLEMFFGGTVTCDDFTSGTVSAAFGGTTTLIDFCMQTPGDTFAQALEKYFEKIERCKPVIDVGFHIGVTDLHTGGTLEDLAKLPAEGVTSYKLFMAYKGAVMVDDETLFRTMETAA